jgi:8-amino-7-oxononanoate synthase
MRSISEIEEYFRKRLQERTREDSLRTLDLLSGQIDFTSNDYLGLARESADDFNQLIPLKHGSGGSRLLAGNSELAEKLEDEIARFHNSESALLYTSGYAANIGLISCLAARNDTILYDDYVHASIRDGIRLSLAKSWSFRHNDPVDLQEKIQKAKGRIFIVVESIYSMGGDPAPLKEFAKIATAFKAGLIVDEAHATGICGEKGEGLVCALGIENLVLARVITFGKALGCHGAAVVSTELMIEYLVNFSRSFIYTTALPDFVLQTIRLHYQKMKSATDKREQLQNTIREFIHLAKELEVPVVHSEHPVQAIIIPGNKAAKSCAEFLRENGMEARAILSPTVPAGEERIRICLHSYNTTGEITYLLHHLKRWLHE